MIAKVDRIPDLHANWKFKSAYVDFIVGHETEDVWSRLFWINYSFHEEEMLHNAFSVGEWPPDSTAYWNSNSTLQYQHAVGVASRDTNSLTLYVNGIKRSEQPWIGIINGEVTKWHIGTIHDSNGKTKLDELRIYNRALSESEIQQIIGQ
jgi:hypothetical protein